jgi:hypothetical protein
MGTQSRPSIFTGKCLEGELITLQRFKDIPEAEKLSEEDQEKNHAY